jgi:hypothetical protein
MILHFITNMPSVVEANVVMLNVVAPRRTEAASEANAMKPSVKRSEEIAAQ